MRSTFIIFRRELASYFATPLAYIFIVIFLVMAAISSIAARPISSRSSPSIPGSIWC
jgi:ABC-type transport system involved in multi-copper enzyme maturation permease subunit